jgi:acetone carboxylase gamma subunit
MPKEKTSAPNTRVMRCTCQHAFQDERYGQNMRVHNAMRKPKPGWRCTVCLKTKEDAA